MPPELEFHVTGPDARSLADELADLMAAELGTYPRRFSEGDSRGKLGNAPENRIEVVAPQSETLELDRADSAEVIEIATEGQRWEKR